MVHWFEGAALHGVLGEGGILDDIPNHTWDRFTLSCCSGISIRFFIYFSLARCTNYNVLRSFEMMQRIYDLQNLE